MYRLDFKSRYSAKGLSASAGKSGCDAILLSGNSGTGIDFSFHGLPGLTCSKGGGRGFFRGIPLAALSCLRLRLNGLAGGRLPLLRGWRDRLLVDHWGTPCSCRTRLIGGAILGDACWRYGRMGSDFLPHHRMFRGGWFGIHLLTRRLRHAIPALGLYVGFLGGHGIVWSNGAVGRLAAAWLLRSVPAWGREGTAGFRKGTAAIRRGRGGGIAVAIGTSTGTSRSCPSRPTRAWPLSGGRIA